MLAQKAWLDADAFTPSVDMIPTGEIRSVEGTPMISGRPRLWDTRSRVLWEHGLTRITSPSRQRQAMITIMS